MYKLLDFYELCGEMKIDTSRITFYQEVFWNYLAYHVNKEGLKILLNDNKIRNLKAKNNDVLSFHELADSFYKYGVSDARIENAFRITVNTYLAYNKILEESKDAANNKKILLSL